MSFTIVNDYFFKADGDIEAGKAAAVQLVDYFSSEVPGVQLSLWLESRENPLHHYHITVFEDDSGIEKLKNSEGIKRFTERLFPHIDHSTYISPGCDVWLADGRGVEKVAYKK